MLALVEICHSVTTLRGGDDLKPLGESGFEGSPSQAAHGQPCLGGVAFALGAGHHYVNHRKDPICRFARAIAWRSSDRFVPNELTVSVCNDYVESARRN